MDTDPRLVQPIEDSCRTGLFLSELDLCGTIAFDNTPADTLRNGAEIFIAPAINQENGNSQIYKRFT